MPGMIGTFTRPNDIRGMGNQIYTTIASRYNTIQYNIISHMAPPLRWDLKFAWHFQIKKSIPWPRGLAVGFYQHFRGKNTVLQRDFMTQSWQHCVKLTISVLSISMDFCRFVSDLLVFALLVIFRVTSAEGLESSPLATMTLEFNFSSGNGLLPDGTKPLPEPISVSEPGPRTRTSPGGGGGGGGSRSLSLSTLVTLVQAVTCSPRRFLALSAAAKRDT